MISVATETETVVQEFTANGEMFSAWDVTRVLRDRLPHDNVRHNLVKLEVHRLFDADELGLYGREQVDVGTRVDPFVYHLPHEDPTGYDPRWVEAQLKNYVGAGVQVASLKAQAQATGQPVLSSVQTPSANAAQISPAQVAQSKAVVAQSNNATLTTYKTIKVTSDGRLNLPVKMLQGFNGRAYLTQAIVPKNGRNVSAITVTNQKPTSYTNGPSYKINADGRVRISAQHLNTIGKASEYSVKYASPLLGHEVIFVIAEV